MEGLTYPNLLGVRVRNAAPLRDVWLELSQGLAALYGRSGAGKTRLLRAIAAAASTGQSDAGQVELVFTWPPPLWDQDTYFELIDDDANNVDDRRWRSLPGNPFGRLLRAVRTKPIDGLLGDLKKRDPEARDAFDAARSGRLL